MTTGQRYPITVTAPIAGAVTINYYADDGVTAVSVYSNATTATPVTQPISIAAQGTSTVYSVERTMKVSCVIASIEMAGGYGLKRSITANAPVAISPDLPPGIGSGSTSAGDVVTGPGGIGAAVTGASTSWDISTAGWFDCTPNGATCTLTISGWTALGITGVILLRPTSSGTLTVAVSGGTVTPATFAYTSGSNALLTVSSDDSGVTVGMSTPIAGSIFGQAQEINAQTGTTYTLVAADVGKLVKLTNASAITLTLPQDSDAAYDIGKYTDLRAGGAGQVTVVAGSGATLRVSGLTAKSRAQYARFGVQKVAANEWDLYGDLAAS